MTEALYVVVKVTFGDFFMNAAMLKEQKRNKKTDKQMLILSIIVRFIRSCARIYTETRF